MRKLLLVLLLPTLALAQQKMLTVEDAVLRQRTTLGPDKLSALAWVPGSDKFTYIAKKSGQDCVVMQDAATMVRDTVLTLDTYNKIAARAIENYKPVTSIPATIVWVNESTYRFMDKSNYYLGNIKNQSAEIFCLLPADAEFADIDPVTGKVAYVYVNNVAVSSKSSIKQAADADGDKGENIDMISKDGQYGLSYGTAAHRREFGITKGTFWSPKGNRLAYYQVNEMRVTDFPVYNLSSKPASAKNIKYPMAGAQSQVVKVLIKDFVHNRVVAVQTGEPLDQYLTNIAWHPGEEKIYIAVLNREQNEMKLNEYDGVTGALIETLFTEQHNKYVEPEKPVLFCKNNPQQFVWCSERDSFNHLYLYGTNGRLLRQLTSGRFDVTQILGFSKDGNTLYYMAASEDGMDRYCYSVEIETGKSKMITMAPGTHTVLLNDNGTYLLDMLSNSTTPRRITLMGTNGDEKAVLLNAINPLAEYKKCELKLFKIKAADGVTDLNCRMFLPAGFDESKKYPALVYVYGGPHAQMVTNNWLGGADLWLYYMAQQGYVVFTMDNRGSAYRGLNFENVTHRNLGSAEKDDQLAGVTYLKNLKYVDAKRMGVFGWSFGGFMTTTLMSKSDVFKAGVAGGPVIDWSMYEIMYTERYMDTPKENEQGYRESNLLNHVKKLNGRLMLIHGTDDDVVLWQHSLDYLKKCVDEKVQVDYFVYPGHLHNVLGKDRVHLMQKVTDHFNRNL